MLCELFGLTLVCEHQESMGWTFQKVIFRKPYDEWTFLEKFCLFAVSQRDINRDSMPCGLWGIFVKTHGDYDRCVVVYHKCNSINVIPPANMVYLVSNIDVCCQTKAIESILR